MHCRRRPTPEKTTAIAGTCFVFCCRLIASTHLPQAVYRRDARARHRHRRVLRSVASDDALPRASATSEGDFPNAERIGRETVTLPLFPAMSEADVERVCRSLCRSAAHNSERDSGDTCPWNPSFLSSSRFTTKKPGCRPYSPGSIRPSIARAALRDYFCQRWQPGSFGRDFASAVRAPPRCHPGRAVQRQLWPAPCHHGRLSSTCAATAW